MRGWPCCARCTLFSASPPPPARPPCHLPRDVRRRLVSLGGPGLEAEIQRAGIDRTERLAGLTSHRRGSGETPLFPLVTGRNQDSNCSSSIPEKKTLSPCRAATGPAACVLCVLLKRGRGVAHVPV